MPVLNQALEAAILRDPDDLEAYAVYGDWLAEQGDPRGELIATQLAAEQTQDPELNRAALRVFAKHRDYFVGELGAMIAADAFTWRAGFIHRAKLSHDRLLIQDGARVASSLAEVVGALFAHPSARFLMDLTIRTNDRDVWNRTIGSQKEIVEQIARARPLVLRRLQLGDAAYGIANVGRLDHVWPALAPLHELALEGEVSLGRLVLPELRSFWMWPMPFRKKLARELVEAKLPKLQSLRMHLANCPEHAAREVVALLHRRDLPALAHLGLLAYRHAARVLDELAHAPLLAQLETLDLRQGLITDLGVRSMLANPGPFQHLARIDLSESSISTRTLARLRALLPNVVGKSP